MKPDDADVWDLFQEISNLWFMLCLACIPINRIPVSDIFNSKSVLTKVVLLVTKETEVRERDVQ
jgi:hypothetical protein